MKKALLLSTLGIVLVSLSTGCSTLKNAKTDPETRKQVVTQFKTIAFNGVAGLLDIEPKATNYVRAVGAVITIALNDKVYDYNEIVKIAEVEIQEFAKLKYRAVARIVLTAYQTAVAPDVADKIRDDTLAHQLLLAARDAINMALAQHGGGSLEIPASMAAKREVAYILDMKTDDVRLIWISDVPYRRCPQDGSLVAADPYFAQGKRAE